MTWKWVESKQRFETDGKPQHSNSFHVARVENLAEGYPRQDFSILTKHACLDLDTGEKWEGKVFFCDKLPFFLYPKIECVQGLYRGLWIDGRGFHNIGRIFGYNPIQLFGQIP